jgi:hypothetical protein
MRYFSSSRSFLSERKMPKGLATINFVTGNAQKLAEVRALLHLQPAAGQPPAPKSSL